MSTIVRNALQEALDKVFTGKDRGALLEVLLHQLLTANGGRLTLTLDEATQLDTSKVVAVSVGEDLTVQITPTNADGAPASRRRSVEAA